MRTRRATAMGAEREKRLRRASIAASGRTSSACTAAVAVSAAVLFAGSAGGDAQFGSAYRVTRIAIRFMVSPFGSMGPANVHRPAHRFDDEGAGNHRHPQGDQV